MLRLAIPSRLKLNAQLIIDISEDVGVEGFIQEVSIYKNGNQNFLTKTKGVIMALVLKDNQKAVGKLKFVDAKGADTDAASVEVSSSNEEAATVTYDDPNNEITVVAGLPGVSALHIVAKDSDGNVLPFEDVAIEVTAGDATSGTAEFATPENQ